MSPSHRHPKAPSIRPQPRKASTFSFLLAGFTVFGLLPFAVAQRSPAEPAEQEKQSTIELSPFTVSASSDVGYLATSSTGGTRLRTDLKDIASQISVMTPEFLEDIAATSLEDAFAYSLNIENLSEYTNAYTNNGDMPSGVGSETRSRTRGLTESSASHDFFFTKVRIDTYNTERITLASGPNSILFGLGSPSGLTDTSFKRAKLGKFSGEVSLRVDDEGSFRKVVDLNVPLIPNLVSVRAVVLDEELDYWRKPSGANNQRLFGTFTFQPFKGTTIRGWYEDANLNERPMRNTIARDSVSKWIAAGKPIFDNAGINQSTASSVVLARIASQGLTGIVARQSNSQQILSVGPIQNNMHMTSWANTVGTLGLAADLPSPDTNIIGTLRDSSIFPWNINYNGNGTLNVSESWIAGIAIEQRLRDNIHMEIGYNREEKDTAFTDMIRGIPILQADANKYLPDGITPNPNAGRLYFESPQSRYSSRYNEREDLRATLSGDFDLTRRSKWLGSHRVAGLYSHERFIDVDAQASDLKIISNHSFTTGTPETQLRNANRNVRVRGYVDDPGTPGGIYWVEVPFDPMAANLDLNGVQIISGPGNPYGASGSTDIVRNRLNSTMGVVQSRWWNNRIVTTYGVRRDALDQIYVATPLRGTGNAPYVPFKEVIAAGLPNYDRSTVGSTRTKSVVVHATPWLSLHFSEANTFSPGFQGANPDGTRIPSPTGRGRDFGFMLVPFEAHKLNIRVNFYEANTGPDSYTLSGAIRNGVGQIERAAVEAGAEPHPTYRPQDFDSEYYAVTASTVSKGIETTVTANFTENWRFSVSVAKSTAKQSDIGSQWEKLLQERIPVWSQHADAFLSGSTTTTIRQAFTNLIDEFNTMEQSNGAKIESGRDWRVNASTRYAFDRGWGKGFFVGSQLRWRSEATPGYIAREIPNKYAFPGVPDRVAVQDRSMPVISPATTNVDVFLGYNRKLMQGKLRWSIQLNVRNALNADTLTLQRPYADGSPRVFANLQPRSYIVTNTFRF